MSTRIDSASSNVARQAVGEPAAAPASASSGASPQRGGWEATIAAPGDRGSFLTGRHPIRMNELAQLRDVLNTTNDPSFGTGGGYVQQEASAIETYMAMLRSLIAHDQGEKAVELFDKNPLGVVGAYLDTTSLQTPWLRLRSIDSQLREWGNPMYASNPDMRQEKALQVAPKETPAPAPTAPSFPAGPMAQMAAASAQTGPFIVKRTEYYGQYDAESRDYYVAVKQVQPGDTIYRGQFRPYTHEIADGQYSRSETRYAPAGEIRAEIYGPVQTF